MSTRPKHQLVHVRVRPDVHDDLKALAASWDVPATWIIRDAISSYLSAARTAPWVRACVDEYSDANEFGA